MAPLRVSVIGAGGRLGQLICQQAITDERFALCEAVVSANSSLLTATKASALNYVQSVSQSVDVLIDVSLPAAQAQVMQALAQHAGTLVSGVTGYSLAQLQRLHSVQREKKILHTHNFARGIAVLKFLAKTAAQLLGPSYQIGVLDVHHRMKADAPSGTALSLEAALRAGGAGEVQHAALRIGSVVGDHQVHFAGAFEQIQLSHHAADRGMFARGALDAALWLAQQPSAGLFQMEDVFGIPRFDAI